MISEFTICANCNGSGWAIEGNNDLLTCLICNGQRVVATVEEPTEETT